MQSPHAEPSRRPLMQKPHVKIHQTYTALNQHTSHHTQCATYWGIHHQLDATPAIDLKPEKRTKVHEFIMFPFVP